MIGTRSVPERRTFGDRRTLKIEIDMGTVAGGGVANLDLEELLATRLLVQGNSGSGKSHLLRRLLEQSAPWVQQAVIDPEGDFVSLAERFGHVVVSGARSEAELQRIAERVRKQRVSVVLDLEALEMEEQLRGAAAFLGGLFEAERDHWYPMLVVVDEAQLFAPTAAGEISDENRKSSLGAMTNLMCRGRKRGLAGVIATQRLAKLAKNVAAEASNFFMGRTFLDIDMSRAADLLGMDRRQAEMFRDLERGHFVALGPALSKRPMPVRIGGVVTETRGSGPGLMPLPKPLSPGARESILDVEADPPRHVRPRPRTPPSTAELLRKVADAAPAPGTDVASATEMTAEERERVLEAVLMQVIADPEVGFRSVAVLYQDFQVRCRMRRIGAPLPDLPTFRRRLAAARAGGAAAPEHAADWDKALDHAARLPEDLQSVFLLMARAAIDGTACPSDAAVARVFGSRSPGRARRILAYLEERNFIVARIDFTGKRIVAVPDLGRETAPGEPKAEECEPTNLQPAVGEAEIADLFAAGRDPADPRSRSRNADHART